MTAHKGKGTLYMELICYNCHQSFNIDDLPRNTLLKDILCIYCASKVYWGEAYFEGNEKEANIKPMIEPTDLSNEKALRVQEIEIILRYLNERMSYYMFRQRYEFGAQLRFEVKRLFFALEELMGKEYLKTKWDYQFSEEDRELFQRNKNN